MSRGASKKRILRSSSQRSEVPNLFISMMQSTLISSAAEEDAFQAKDKLIESSIN